MLEGNTKMTSRNYCFTTFNMNWDFHNASKNVRYMILQLEETKEGKEHYQGYLELDEPLRINRVKTILGDDTMHLEKRRGTKDEAINYCKKKESQLDGPWEFGNPEVGQGHRSDLEEISLAIKNKATLKDLATNYTQTFIKYPSGITKVKGLIQEKRNQKTKLIIYWGDAGTGKTRKAYEENPDAYFKPNGMWWDGYDNQKCVIIDDYDGYIGFREFLQLTDRYPHKVPFKGGFTEFNSEKIIITSNIDPEYWYMGERLNKASNDAFNRRIDEKREFRKENPL